MNRRLPRRQTLLLCLAALIVGLTSSRLCAVPAAIPANIKASTSITPTDAKIITDSVKAEVDRLAGDDAEARKSARETLINDAVAPAGGASTQYLAALTTNLDAALLPLTKHQNVLVRLNAAIVAAKVAERADNPNLRNTVLALLGDENEAVVLWGLKAAKFVIPAVLQNPVAAKGDKLTPAIVGVYKAHPAAAAIEEAYPALMLNYNDPNNKINNYPPQVWKAMVAVALTEVGKLMEVRLAAYKTGMPVAPLADRAGANFLVHPATFKAQDKNQLKDSAQMVMNLMALAAQRSTAATGTDKDQLVNVVRDSAKALSALAGQIDKEKTDKEIQPVLAPLLTASSQTPNLPGLVATVPPAMQKLLPSVVPPTLPSTQPAH